MKFSTMALEMVVLSALGCVAEIGLLVFSGVSLVVGIAGLVVCFSSGAFNLFQYLETREDPF